MCYWTACDSGNVRYFPLHPAELPYRRRTQVSYRGVHKLLFIYTKTIIILTVQFHIYFIFYNIIRFYKSKKKKIRLRKIGTTNLHEYTSISKQYCLTRSKERWKNFLHNFKLFKQHAR